MYPITQKLIPGLPQVPFHNGVGKYEGVVAHATADYGATDEAEATYESGNWKSAFVHFFVDWDSITQVASTNYQAWGAGPQANPHYLHVELCQVKNDGTPEAKAKFWASFNRYCWLIASLLFNRKIGVQDAETLWSHKEVSDNLGGTDHQDPIDYLKEWGVTWADVVRTTTWKYAEMGGNNMTSADAQKVVDILGAVFGFYDAAGISQQTKDEIHRLANEVRKAGGLPTT